MTTKRLGRLVATLFPICVGALRQTPPSMKGLLILVMLFWSSTSFAQTEIQPSQINGTVALKNAVADAALYVSTAGKDSNDGLSPGSAKATLPGALSACPSPGAVCWIRFGAGTFTGTAELPVAASNVQSIRITGINTQRGAPNGGVAGGTVFRNRTTSTPTITIAPNTSGVTIENIYFTSSTLSSTTPHILVNAGTGSGIASELYIQGNYFNAGGYGVQVIENGAGSAFEVMMLHNQFGSQTTDCIHMTSNVQGQVSQITIHDNRCQLFGANGIYSTNGSGMLIDDNQITANASSSGSNIYINAGGGAATTISNNLLEALPSASGTNYAMDLKGNSFTITNNEIFNTYNAISCTCSYSTIGTNNFGYTATTTGWDITLTSSSTGNLIGPQNGTYPNGYFKDNSGTLTNQMFNIDGNGTDQLGVLLLNGYTFSTLPGSPTNGMVLYCNNCTIANPCASGGNGAIAKRLNGVWVCN